MRKKFSERHGFKTVREAFQTNSIDVELNNRLWNQVRNFYIDSLGIDFFSDTIDDKSGYYFFIKVYDEFFKSDSKPSSNIHEFRTDIKERYSQLEWYEIYDLVSNSRCYSLNIE